MYQIREAEPNELPDIDELVMAANEEFRDGIPERFLADWERSHRRAGDRARHGRVLVAEEDGRLVGTVVIVLSSDGRDTVEIEGLAVLPSVRRRGVARSLMDAALGVGRETRGRHRRVGHGPVPARSRRLLRGAGVPSGGRGRGAERRGAEAALVQVAPGRGSLRPVGTVFYSSWI